MAGIVRNRRRVGEAEFLPNLCAFPPYVFPPYAVKARRDLVAGLVRLECRFDRQGNPSPCPLRQGVRSSRGPYSASNASSIFIWASISSREAGVSASGGPLGPVQV